MHRARRILAKAWWYLRQVTGDAAYENYLRCWKQAGAAHSCRRASAAPLDRKAFYLEQLQRRYSGVSRCC